MKYERLKQVIINIPQFKFLVYQAATVKIELTLRDYIYYNIIEFGMFVMKEVSKFGNNL